MNDRDLMLDAAMDQAKADEVLSDIDIGYIRECVDEQLENLLSTTSKKNYLKVIEKTLEEGEVDKEYSDAICANMYSEIIDKISERFGFEIDKTESNLRTMAKTLYKFFVIKYTENIVYFIESAIIEHQKEIIGNLTYRDGIINHHIEGVNSKMSLILNNISDVVDIISGLELTFEDFISLIIQHEDSGSSAEQMREYEMQYMSDTEGIVPEILKSLIDEEEGFGNIYTDLQRNLYTRFSKE